MVNMLHIKKFSNDWSNSLQIIGISICCVKPLTKNGKYCDKKKFFAGTEKITK